MGELFIPTHKHQKAQLLYAEGDVVFVTTETKTYFLPARHFIWIPYIFQGIGVGLLFVPLILFTTSSVPVKWRFLREL
ncbi:cupin domain-containing protein [Flavobacterium daejeonense]|uniref:hypothetical protein n=1 Tax=Flavobacterium daejeonense TaxID=350893 RepID=UPI00047CA344|nr:hypothetical protein [Flavobacterium daejeonense]